MLTETIDKSYEVFAKYNPTRPLDICTDCCMAPEDEAKLASFPVRKIPRDLLAEYNDGGRPEKTRIEEIKHFLPRYFDLLRHFDFPTHSAELSFSRLLPFDKTEWTSIELDLLNSFFVEYFKHCLSVYPLPSFNERIDAILIMLWKVRFNTLDLLTIWESSKTKESTLHFRDLYLHGFNHHNHTKLSSSFGDKELAQLLRNWVETETVKQNFMATIESLIVDGEDLDEIDSYELNLLYDIMRTKENGL